jgi:hypothetical protein
VDEPEELPPDWDVPLLPVPDWLAPGWADLVAALPAWLPEDCWLVPELVCWPLPTWLADDWLAVPAAWVLALLDDVV